MTYYIKGGSRYNEANPTVWCALILTGYADGLYVDEDWKTIGYENRLANKDPYWLLGSTNGGAQTAEFGLYNDFRIEIDQSTGIRGWNGSSWIDLLAGGGSGVSDIPYDQSWDGDTDAATKNVLYDKIEELLNSSLGLTLFLHQDASGDVVGYRLLSTEFPDDAKTEVFNATISSDDQEIEQWVTPEGVPNLLFFLHGIYQLHLHAYKFSGAKDVRLYFKVYKRAAGGAETLLGTSHESTILSGVEEELELHAEIHEQAILATDRIVLKIFAGLEGAGNNPVVYFYVEGDTLVRFLVPVNIDIIGTLNDIGDVIITTPADNEVLAYDNGSSKWINQTPAEAGLSVVGHIHDGATLQLDGINSDGGAFPFTTTNSISVDMVNAGATIFSITNSGAGVASLDVTGNITVSGTVDGVNVSARDHAATVAGDLNLNDLNEKDHISLANVTAAQHHAVYTNANAVAAVLADDAYLKLVGDTMNGSINMNSNSITGVNTIVTLSVDSYDKLRVWNSNLYTIGMRSAMTYGGLNSYAMTFTMNNDAARGFVWRDFDDAQNDGAMSLTTGGILTVKSSLQLAGGAVITTLGDIAALANSDVKVPTNTTVKEYVDLRLLITEIDDAPVDGVTVAPISSNWAFDHKSSPADIKHLTDIQLAALHTKYTNNEAVDAIEAVGIAAPISTDWLIFSDAGVLKKVAMSTLTPTIMTGLPKYTGAEALAYVNAQGLALANTKVITSQDADLTFIFGRTQIDSRFADMMTISHRAMSAQDNYAFGQLNDGKTYINAPTGKLIYLQINDVNKMSMSAVSLNMGIPIAMGTNKITGLTAGSATGEAVEFDQLHAIVTVNAPIVLTGQDIELKNDAGAQVTEIDTSTLANSDTKIPTNTTVKEAIDLLKEKGATFPGSPVEGDLHYDTVDEALYRRSGDAQAWIQIGASGIGGNVYLEIGIASDDLAFSNDAERGVFSATYAKIKEITVLKTLSIRVYWEHRSWAIPGETKTRVYINGVATGSEHTATTTSYVAFTEDVEVNKGDLLQIYGHYVDVLTTQVRNMRIKYSEFVSNDP